jgi:hypothetical protein
MIARLPGFKIAVGIPTEEQRMRSDPREIDAYFERLEYILVDFPADMVMNLDETGHCEWVDARTEPVIVSDDFPGVTIRVPVKRQSERSTVLGRSPRAVAT